MGVATWLGAAAVGLVVVIVVVVGVVLVALRRGRPASTAAPERDAWEQALLADSPAPRPVPGQPTGSPAATGPEVLQRDALVEQDRGFDPAGWDDRPDGFEGTDMGLVGGDDS